MPGTQAPTHRTFIVVAVRLPAATSSRSLWTFPCPSTSACVRPQPVQTTSYYFFCLDRICSATSIWTSPHLPASSSLHSSRVLSTATTHPQPSKLATQTLPAIQTPYSRYTHSFQRPLTPAHTPEKHYPDPSAAPPRLDISDSDRSWWAPSGQRGSDGQVPMSRPTGTATHSPIRDDVSNSVVQPTPQLSPTHPNPVGHAPQRESPRDVPSTNSISLPPLRQMSSTPPLNERRPGGPLGMHSILNPQADLLEQQRSRRQSASHIELPSPTENPTPPNLPSISRPTSVDSTQGEMMPARHFQPPRPPRRGGPMSPTAHRSQSLSVLNPPTGTIDAHQSPFLSPSGRLSGVDSITSQPALPTPPVVGLGPRPTYFPTVPTPPPGMVRNELQRASMSFPQSGSASPIAGYSPYSQPASVASSQFDNGTQQAQYASTAASLPMPESHQIPMTMDVERGRIPMAPTGQSSIQIMTIKSQQGHHVQIPVDVQAASKVADEKRKRNAGASARFRARRKEKEREASMSIARLEQQLRDAMEDRDFYRGERDYFQHIVYQQPGAERHYQRPSSPRLRRPSVAPSNAASSNTGGGSAGSPYSAYEDDDIEPDRNVRRRTSTYHPPLGQINASMNGTGPSSNYSSTAYPSVNPVAAGIPSHHAQQQTQPHGFEARDQRMHPEQQQLPGQRPQLHDPFSSEPRYEQRHWAQAPGQARENR